MGKQPYKNIQNPWSFTETCQNMYIWNHIWLFLKVQLCILTPNLWKQKIHIHKSQDKTNNTNCERYSWCTYFIDFVAQPNNQFYTLKYLSNVNT